METQMMNRCEDILQAQSSGPDYDLLHPVKGCIHDIRNMLSVIEGNAFLVSENELPDDVQVNIQSMEHAAQHAEVLYNQLMNYLSLEYTEPEPVNLSDMIDEIGVLLRSVVFNKDFIDFELEKDLPCIKGVAAQLQRIVINLALNASQAIGNKRGLIRISTNMSACGNRVELTVSDNGCGIDDEMLSNIFDASFTTKEKGTGVGLSAVRSIVQKHGGTISVDSNPNRGATFTTLFPAIERSSAHAIWPDG